MILDFCPRCNRKVVSQQVTKDYHFSDNKMSVKAVDQVICNICGVTVSLITEEKDLMEDLKKIHNLIRKQNSAPTYASFR